MNRREIIKSSLVSPVLLPLNAWVTPAVVSVVLPAHAMTSEMVYSGFGSSPSTYQTLRKWMGTVTKRADGSYAVSVQNTNNTARIVYLIAFDEIGIAGPASVITPCTDIRSEGDGGITAISSSEITLGIVIQVLGEFEEISITLPLATNGISFPPLEQVCFLS